MKKIDRSTNDWSPRPADIGPTTLCRDTRTQQSIESRLRDYLREIIYGKIKHSILKKRVIRWGKDFPGNQSKGGCQTISVYSARIQFQI